MSDLGKREGSRRTRVRRVPQRGHYDRGTVYAILDSALICHVAFVDGAVPHITPMARTRSGDELLLHRSNARRLMRAQDNEADLQLPVWAGEIPPRTSSPEPVSDPVADPDLRVPGSLKRFLTERLPLAYEQALEESLSS
jgi:hypothetical protein